MSITPCATGGKVKDRNSNPERVEQFKIDEIKKGTPQDAFLYEFFAMNLLLEEQFKILVVGIFGKFEVVLRD